jgi:hypothetical protein
MQAAPDTVYLFIFSAQGSTTVPSESRKVSLDDSAAVLALLLLVLLNGGATGDAEDNEDAVGGHIESQLLFLIIEASANQDHLIAY